MASAARLFRTGALVAVVSALAAFAASSSPASTALTCSGSAVHPFVPWLDPSSYVQAPSGTFESTSGWTFAGGAKVVTGNEPFKVHSSADSHSLSIPAGASAMSPAFCVDLGSPTIRFFAVGGNLLSLLKVDVVYKTVLGTITQPVTVVPAMGAWGPTLPSVLLANVTGLTSLNGVTSSVQLKFTALGSAGWKIDDVYVDPWKTT